MSDFDEQLREYNKAREEKANEFIKSMLARMPFFIALAIALWWVFYGTIRITGTKMTITEQIGTTVCTIALSLSYTSLIAQGGFDSARHTREYIETKDTWQKNVREGNIWKKEIIEYAKGIAEGNLYEVRKSILETNGIKYETIFDSNGKFIYTDYKKDKALTRHQKKMIKRCVNAKIILPTIFGNVSAGTFGMKKEETLSAYKAKTFTTGAIVKTVLSMVSVGLMFEFIGFSWGSMIYALFQIVLWTASGFSRRLKNYSFIMDTIVPQMEEKSLIIRGYLDSPEHKKDLIKAEENSKQETENKEVIENGE